MSDIGGREHTRILEFAEKDRLSENRVYTLLSRVE